MKLPVFYTLGVYGSTEKDFFTKLEDNKIDTFCDIRLRRGLRGKQYAFANSERLQQKLEALSIHYLHETGLAPTNEIKTLQESADRASRIPRRQREELSPAFRSAYKRQVLSRFDFKKFISRLEDLEAQKVVLFCVEKSPGACHRSIVTERLKQLHPRLRVIDL